MDMVTWVQIQDEAIYISHNAHAFGKSMNLTILPPTLDKQEGRLGS